MADDEHILLKISSEPRYLGVVRAAVETASKKMGLSDDEAARITLAVDEAVTNVIRHGYRGATGQPIWLKMSPRQRDGRDGIEIVVEDRCSGVDLSRIKSRPLEEVRPGGLGVHIITGVMDEVEYQSRDDGQGVRLRMAKFTQPAGAQAPAPAPAPEAAKG